MQKLLPTPGGLNAYAAAPQMLVNAASRACPFCPSKHRLRSHGHYRRQVLLPDGRTEVILVQRLLCAHVGQTVSLLPDFCIPRRQHGPAILGALLSDYAAGKSLTAALRAARSEAPGHSVAQSLRAGFLLRDGRIRTYLAAVRARVLEPPPQSPDARGRVRALLVALCSGFTQAVSAFVHHGVGLHAMQQLGLA